MTVAVDGVLDVLGIGFGPANLALACAVQEWNDGCAPGRRLSALFLERSARFGWYPDLLLPGAKCQVAFAKDLATPRDPRSRFTFLNYLHQQGRLHEFFDYGDVVPSRAEFADYFDWAANELAPLVRYGRRAMRIEPDGERPQILTVRADGPAGGESFEARNVVAAIGGTPVLPPGIEVRPGGRAFHAGAYLTALARCCPRGAGRYTVAVVGGGQSAADIVLHLLREYPETEVEWITRGYALRSVDANPFVNAFFRPATIDVFYGLPEATRRRLNDDFHSTGYGIVDPETLLELHRLGYQERVRNGPRQRLRLRSLTEVAGLTENDRRARVTVRHLADGGTEPLDCDAVVFATGYRRTTAIELFAPLNGVADRDERGELRLRRDYSVCGLDGAASLFVQGFAAGTHGIGDEALSNVATRAGEILAALAARQAVATG